jgi:hypothetical protein
MSILYTKAEQSGSKVPSSWWTGGPLALANPNNNTRSFYSNLGDELRPKLPLIDVVQDFPWTLTPTRSEARKEAPFIYLREWLQLDTQLNQCLKPYGREQFTTPLPTGQTLGSNIFGTDGTLSTALDTLNGLFETIDLDPEQLYAGLFDHLTPTDFIYKLPFFTEEYFSIQNNWSGVDVIDGILKLQSQGLGLGKGLFNTLIKKRQQAANNNDTKADTDNLDPILKLPYTLRQFEIFNLQSRSPAVGFMDPPHVWKSTNNRQYSFSFPLYNIDATNDSKSESLILKNWEFCYLLTYQNLINKGNFYTAIPPVFYEVTIPGIHYCKASYMSSIGIENIGNIRLMRLPINGDTKVDVNVPDGYLITITMNDLLMPSKNLLHAAVNTETRQKIQQGII